MDVKTGQLTLDKIKNSVRNSYEYFLPNYTRFNEFRRFVFESSLSPDEINILIEQGKPQLEFNICEAYISRQLGEFSKNEPDIMVSADDENTADPMTIKVLEQHLRHVFSDSNCQHTKYEMFKDILTGGFSVGKVSTDYANKMSFRQVINIERASDPTLCGFDVLARESHKGDGSFCFELCPMSKDDFMDENPDISINNINFTRNFSGFNWSYMNNDTPTILVCYFYEKKKKEERIVQLSNKKVMTVKAYEKMENNWNSFLQIPKPIGKTRKTIMESIDRYKLIDNKIIERIETDFSYLPLVFFDGNSILLKTPKDGNIRQFTRPSVYNARGAQRLKNYAGNSVANEIENTVQHKFMVAKEALPKEEDFLEAYKDVQRANVLVYNSVYEDNPEQPIANPVREIQRVPAPPEIMETFIAADKLMQNILGSYDASLGINDNQLSGAAIREGATQSNSTAMPYIVGFMQGLQRCGEIYVDLFPKYYTSPTTIPILDDEGKRSFVKINQDEGVDMFYDSNALNVIVKAGASFQVQKSRTLMMTKEIMGMSPDFGKFMSTKGLNFILDNMEGRGIEQLKELAKEFQKQQEEMAKLEMQEKQNMANSNPQVMKNQISGQKMQLDAQKNQQQFMIDMAKLKQDESKVLADLEQSKQSTNVQLVKAETERFSKIVDLHLQNKDLRHKHLKEAIETHHLVNSPKNREVKYD